MNIKKMSSIGVIIVAIAALGGLVVHRTITGQTTGTSTWNVERDGTSISPAVQTNSQFSQRLLQGYPHLKNTLDKDSAPEFYVIPGLKTTKSINSTTGATTIDRDMDPQGLAVTSKYVIISAYSHSKTSNSVLYFLNKKTGDFVKQIVLPNTSHVGGLAYDSVTQRLWVTTESSSNTATLSAYDDSTIDKANFEKTHQVTKFDHVISLPQVKRASFMTYHNNALYVGYFTLTNQGKFLTYPLNDQGIPATSSKTTDLRGNNIYNSSYTTNAQLQGVTFYNGQIIFSQSYGPKSSKLLVFDNDGQKSWIDFDNDDILKTVLLPPYLEQVVVDNGNLYALFESGTTTYRKTNLAFHSDRVIKLNLTPLLK